MRTAQGNGPLSTAHFGPIPAQKVIHKEMVSANMLMGRPCSSSLSQEQLPQGLERIRPLVTSGVISLCKQSLLPPALCSQNQFHWSTVSPNLTKKVPAQVRGERSPHTKMMVPDPSSALCPVLLMLSKKLNMVKTHISASLLTPFASSHHPSWVGQTEAQIPRKIWAQWQLWGISVG